MIGVATAIIGGAQGIGFAIPVDRARRIVSDLVKFGHVKPVWVGPPRAHRRLARGGRPREGLPRPQRGPRLPRATRPASSRATRSSSGGLDADRFRGVLRDDALDSRPRQADEDRAQERRRASGPSRSRARIPPRTTACASCATSACPCAPRGAAFASRSWTPDGAAAQAGLETGDALLALNGTAVADTDDVNKVLARDQSRTTLVMVVGRGSWEYTLTFPLD